MTRRDLIKSSPLLAGAIASMAIIPETARGIIVTLRDDFEFEDADAIAEMETTLVNHFPNLEIVILHGANVQVVS